jgi:ABC-2 type transport system ATP-binding protein
VSAATTPAVELDHVGKRYWKLDDTPSLLRSLLAFGRTRKSELWAVRDLSFTVGTGETVGILGRNGAGKTTMLRMLAGVSTPTAGRLRVVGRIAPLISVGVGFNRELTGRENVFVNGMMLGLTATQVRQRFDEIVAFAELGDFIDTPVKYYSSGMFMRLGFAVAVHTEPDVLLVDEVLAVGDAAFQAKCFDRMRDLKARGATIVLVTHSMHAIRLLCERAILIRYGALDFDGDVEEGISRYHQALVSGADPNDAGGGATILAQELVGLDGPTSYADPDTPLEVHLRVRFDRAVTDPVFGIAVAAADGRVAYGWHSPAGYAYRSFAEGEETTVQVSFEPRLVGGSYHLTAAVAERDGTTMLATDSDGPWFYVSQRPSSWGIADLNAQAVVGDHALDDERLRPMSTEGPAATPR